MRGAPIAGRSAGPPSAGPVARLRPGASTGIAAIPSRSGSLADSRSGSLLAAGPPASAHPGSPALQPASIAGASWQLESIAGSHVLSPSARPTLAGTVLVSTTPPRPTTHQLPIACL